MTFLTKNWREFKEETGKVMHRLGVASLQSARWIIGGALGGLSFHIVKQPYTDAQAGLLTLGLFIFGTGLEFTLLSTPAEEVEKEPT